MRSITVSKLLEKVSFANFIIGLGQGEIINASKSFIEDGRVCHNFSVIKGINGCNNLKEVSKTCNKIDVGIILFFVSSYILIFVNSR